VQAALLNFLEFFLCLVHNTADISQASPAERMLAAARASSALFLSKDLFHDQGSAFVFLYLFCYVFF
jgi:hypothetical protein